jgi:hypothetical protein
VLRAQNGETEEDDEYSDESELTVYKQQRDALYRKALEAGSKKIGKILFFCQMKESTALERCCYDYILLYRWRGFLLRGGGEGT